MAIYDGSMELRMKFQCTSDEAERLVLQHQSSVHPEIQCQCLECLYARELLAQCRAWRSMP